MIHSENFRIPETIYRFEGFLKRYLDGVAEQWLKVAPASNPAMLEMFRDRDRKPLRNLVPWAGEFAGKYLTSAVQVLRLTADPALRLHLGSFVRDLTSLQDADGYLGPWPREHRLTGWAPNTGKEGGGTWDAWGHYHVMLGLLLWHEDTGDARALRAARRIGDLLCRKFLGKKERRLVDTGSTEMNLAPVHSLCLLYERTKEQRYLDLALQVVKEFSAMGPENKPLAGNYLNEALAGKEFFQTPKPRWESLHPILGLAELYRMTGDERYRQAFEHIWWSIVKLDRHNNGGFSSGEQAQGNPYHPGAIETCCTVAWIATSVEMLRLSGHSVVADELELSTLNSIVGMHSHTGRWVTYDTPMSGVRKASAHHIVFQAREGSPELNCCSVNGPRGFGLISDWAILGCEGGLVLNWYGPSTFTVPLPSGVSVTLRQDTDYPRSGRVRVHISPDRPAEFLLKLRIPYWSARTRIRVNGQTVPETVSGSYVGLERRWKRGDTIDLALDMSLHFWSGEQECQDSVSIYRGPILLTYDRRFNDFDPGQIPVCDATGLAGRLKAWRGAIPPILLLEIQAADGKTLRLCDFGSAGEGGSPYQSWLPVRRAPLTPFSRNNPLRSGRMGQH
ncbi:MAG: glycoside hydrolase family 127 protein [Planctomycetes bacterium]|nr:glycoside hydrolase family 127 protein [Planctomycetota bacterium]